MAKNDKRRRQNRAKREARAARSARAGEATAIGEGLIESQARRGDSSGTGEGRPAGGGRPRKKKGWFGQRQSPYTVPGQRAVTMAFMFAIVIAATFLISPLRTVEDVPLDDPRLEDVEIDEEQIDETEIEVPLADPRVTDAQREAADPDAENVTITIETYEVETEERIFESESPGLALAVLTIPSILCGVALYFTKRPQRPTAWNVCLMLFAGYVVLFGSLALLNLPAIIALAIGTFQTRKAAAEEKLAARRTDADGAVIDVDGEEVADVDADAEADDPADDDLVGDDDDAEHVEDPVDDAIDADEQR